MKADKINEADMEQLRQSINAHVQRNALARQRTAARLRTMRRQLIWLRQIDIESRRQAVQEVRATKRTWKRR